ncbi:4Fe-4S dicluster domain-containing protein [Fodinicola acaciae]|uniref:4Fe-4S dicluster domain-containing protein n=1 Tax=Fodinicola acaciae TaxID=2681555 RepID=UPI001FE9B033|nr:4Fe-4S dicluster domain-containing protein [Fodinicola acaciae]
MAGLGALIDALAAAGYRVVGPTVRDSAIVLDELRSVADLPSGWGVTTAPGSYRLHRRADPMVFAHSAGPQAWKRFLHPSRQQLWSTAADGTYQPAEPDPSRYALLGVRGCDLAAIRVLDGVLARSRPYARRRRDLFVIGVNCTEPGGVCFCASMHTGPEVGAGYDLALTEQVDERGHRFVVEVGTSEGAKILSSLDTAAATDAEIGPARRAVADAAGKMGREMPAGDLRTLLRDARESAHWDDVAGRCLTCGNCTMVCPTCFCTTTEDLTDLAGDHTERWERWSSCFELDFSYVHGGSVRTSGASRYRQWLTHKLSSWHDQFGGSGCVGCGRCVAWCPVGIDITEEVARLGERTDG